MCGRQSRFPVSAGQVHRNGRWCGCRFHWSGGWPVRQHRIPYCASARPAWYGRPFPTHRTVSRFCCRPGQWRWSGHRRRYIHTAFHGPACLSPQLTVHGCRMRGTGSGLPRGAPPSPDQNGHGHSGLHNRNSQWRSATDRNGSTSWFSGCRWHRPLRRGGHCVDYHNGSGWYRRQGRFPESDGRIHHIPGAIPARQARWLTLTGCGGYSKTPMPCHPAWWGPSPHPGCILLSGLRHPSVP